MSSMTIDQLKKSLTEQGITLPPSRSKKADYIKLYNQYSTINDSLGDVYASDDDNPPRTGSQSVTSSTSPGKNYSIEKEVESLSDDELYQKLKEFDSNIGPILKNTRRVYEKKLIKLLSSGKNTNTHELKSQTDNSAPSMDEFSDSDIEIISKSPKKVETKSTRKGSVLRDSPKPSLPESSEVEKSLSANHEYSNRSSTPNYSSEIKTSRYSYIETVPKGSSYGFIEQVPDVGIDNELRNRYLDKFNTDKYRSDFMSSDKYSTTKSVEGKIYKPLSNIDNEYKSTLETKFQLGKRPDDQYTSPFNMGGQYKTSLGMSSKIKSGVSGNEGYIGSWEPNINRYLGASMGTQRKISVLPKKSSSSTWLKKILTGFLLLLILLAVIYLYQQWSTTDPYKMLEDDAEKAIEQLQEGSGGN